MNLLTKIKEAEKKAQKLVLEAEKKSQEILKEATIKAEKLEVAGREELKEKISQIKASQEEELSVQREEIIKEANLKIDKMKKNAENNTSTALNLILTKFEETNS